MYLNLCNWFEDWVPVHEIYVWSKFHYSDVIMSAMVSQISLVIANDIAMDFWSHLRPISPTWINFNPGMYTQLHPHHNNKAWGEITYRFPNFNRNGYVLSSHTLLGMRLLTHTGIKFCKGLEIWLSATLGWLTSKSHYWWYSQPETSRNTSVLLWLRWSNR